MNPLEVGDYLVGLQKRIVAELERVDGRRFRSDPWERSEGGGERAASSRKAACSSAAG